ncbi:hypothetical protein CFOL_v3_34737 [Cephalotus follicularis]|uniref:Uncharacterized protein n=1 Tax=Cephalotus follicularis TaxID=3775 RepID=A0A1Q3DFX1_CEPFO|nr:hypothetical protein CFOL_v3_34737 [Cephalotus follicularis]
MTIDIIRSTDPSFKNIPMEILNDSRYMPHFKFKEGDNLQVLKRFLIMPIHPSGVSSKEVLGYGKKWKIIKSMPSYPYNKQVKIVVATMALHNFIRRNSTQDIDFETCNTHDSEDTDEIQNVQSEVTVYQKVQLKAEEEK